MAICVVICAGCTAPPRHTWASPFAPDYLLFRLGYWAMVAAQEAALRQAAAEVEAKKHKRDPFSANYVALATSAFGEEQVGRVSAPASEQMFKP